MSRSKGYILDNDEINNLTRRIYPASTFPKLHERIDDLIDRGLIISSIEVVGEMLKKLPDKNPDKWLTETEKTYHPDFNLSIKWVQKHMSIFKELDSTVENYLKQLTSDYPHAIKVESASGFDADLHLIALAMGRDDWAVVTHETPTNSTNNLSQIPDICKDVGVPCMRLLDMLQENKWIF